jgi:predicted Na+-dependent transporter
VAVHFLSAIAATIVAALIVAITHSHSFLSVFLIFVSSALGIPMIPVLIYTAVQK